MACVRTAGFHLAAKTEFGVGVTFDTEVSWGFNLVRDGFQYKASVEGDYVRVITEKMFAAFKGDSGLSESDQKGALAFIGNLVSSGAEHLMDGVLNT